MSAVIIGLPQAMAKVAAIPVVAEAAGRAGIAAGSVQIALAARALAPKRTGALAASIVPIPDGVAVVQPYAGFVEYGTSKMAAQAYLGPAVDSQQELVGAEIEHLIRTALYAL